MLNHLLMKLNLYAFLSMLVLSGTISIVSGQTKLVNPDLPNNYIDSYILPDGTFRIIGSEHGRNRELFYVD